MADPTNPGLLNSSTTPPISTTGAPTTPAQGVGTSTAPTVSDPNATDASVSTNGQPSTTVGQVNPSLISGAATYTLDPSNTASGQVSQIIDQNSPLMQQAQTAGLQQANSRGLLNSSIAVGAAQGEVLKAATPLAEQNSAAMLQAGLANTAAENQVASQNQSATNTAADFNAQAKNTIAGMQLTQANQVQLQNLVSANAQTIQANSNISSMYNSTMAQIQAIQTSTSMDGPAKQQAITNAINNLQQGIAATTTAATASGTVNGVSADTLNSVSNLFNSTVAANNSTEAGTQNNGQAAPADSGGSYIDQASNKAGNAINQVGNAVNDVVSNPGKSVSNMLSGLSDRRAKENIKLIGKYGNGLPKYEFNYIGQPETYIGVMSDDVRDFFPAAVGVADNGMDLVHYGMLGLRMERKWDEPIAA